MQRITMNIIMLFTGLKLLSLHILDKIFVNQKTPTKVVD